MYIQYNTIQTRLFHTRSITTTKVSKKRIQAYTEKLNLHNVMYRVQIVNQIIATYRPSVLKPFTHEDQ